jgi:hypothetical protein
MLSEGSRRWFTERRLCLRLLLKHALNCFSQSVDDLVVRDAMLARFDHCCRDRLGELAPSCNIRQRSAPSIRVRALSWITIANINLSDRWKVSIDSAKLIAFNKQFEQASDHERISMTAARRILCPFRVAQRQLQSSRQLVGRRLTIAPPGFRFHENQVLRAIL